MLRKQPVCWPLATRPSVIKNSHRNEAPTLHAVNAGWRFAASLMLGLAGDARMVFPRPA